MTTRLIVNLSQTYIAMYLTYSLSLPKVRRGCGEEMGRPLPPGRPLWTGAASPSPEVHRNHSSGDVLEWLLLLLPHEAGQQAHREERE